MTAAHNFGFRLIDSRMLMGPISSKEVPCYRSKDSRRTTTVERCTPAQSYMINVIGGGVSAPSRPMPTKLKLIPWPPRVSHPVRDDLGLARGTRYLADPNQNRPMASQAISRQPLQV
jgi:hypothetical protein